MFFFFKQKTAYGMRISDWSSDVCSSDLQRQRQHDRTQEDRQLHAGVPLGLGWRTAARCATPPVRDSANPGSSMGPAHGLVTARMACDAAAPARQPGDTGTIQARPLALIGAQDRKSTRLNSSH